jgi:nicotinamidase-related amidase
MNKHRHPDSIVHEVMVHASPVRAFEIFTTHFADWWPQDNTWARENLDTVVMEPNQGGRWYERTVQGKETDWGRVLVWEPPNRCVLSWQINPNWQPEIDPERASEVEIRFEPQGPSVTNVIVEHYGFDRHGPEGHKVRDPMTSEGGWPLFLKRFKELADMP